MHHLVGRRAAVEGAGVGVLEDDHAARLDSRVVGVDGDGGEIGEAHVRNEAGALVDLQQRLLAVLPFGDAHFAGEQAGLDPHVGQRLGETEGPTPHPAVFARLGRDAAAHVVVALFLGAALVDGRKGEIACEAAGGRAGVDPGEFERDQGEHEVFRAFDKTALQGVHEAGGDPGGVVGLEQFVLLRSPFVTIPCPPCHQPGDEAARDPARGLNEHLEIVPVLITPHDLAHVVTGQGSECLAGFGGSGRFHGIWGRLISGRRSKQRDDRKRIPQDRQRESRRKAVSAPDVHLEDKKENDIFRLGQSRLRKQAS